MLFNWQLTFLSLLLYLLFQILKRKNLVGELFVTVLQFNRYQLWLLQIIIINIPTSVKNSRIRNKNKANLVITATFSFNLQLTTDLNLFRWPMLNRTKQDPWNTFRGRKTWFEKIPADAFMKERKKKSPQKNWNFARPKGLHDPIEHRFGIFKHLLIKTLSNLAKLYNSLTA